MTSAQANMNNMNLVSKSKFPLILVKNKICLFELCTLVPRERLTSIS